MTLSATIEDKGTYLPSSVIAQLSAECAGVRLANEELHDELAPQFKGRVLLRHKHGRAIEPEWLAKLKHWGAVVKES
jgi:hypothetical protein